MEKKYITTKAYLPGWLKIIAAFGSVILAMIAVAFLFPDFPTKTDPLFPVISFIFIGVGLNYLVNYTLSIILQSKYSLILQNNVLTCRGFIKNRWQLSVADIQAIDSGQGRSKIDSATVVIHSKYSSNTGFYLKSKNKFFEVPFKIQDYEALIQDLKSLNPNLIVENVTTIRDINLANTAIMDDQKMYASGNNFLRITLWAVGGILILFAIYVMFAI